MKKKHRIHSAEFKIFVSMFLFFTVYFSSVPVARAKVYIDITSPAFRKLPLTISFEGSEEVRDIHKIVKDDLDFTGIFDLIDPDIPGAEIKAHINVEISEKLKADVSVLDIVRNKEILNKKYTSSKEIMRTLSHSISSDIFKVITGRKGIFRTKISYILSSSDKRMLSLMDWDGHGTMRIVTRGLTLSHSWYPDSKYIIFSSERSRKWEVYLLNLSNYREMMLFSSKGLNLVGGGSPDGRIAFSSSKDGSPEIYVMNMNSGIAQKLTRSFGIDISPVFSADGSQIAFVSDRGGSPQIYVMNADGTRIRRLTFEGSYNTSPAWSPDGKWIAFVGRKNGKNQIFMIQSDGVALRQITEEGNNENPSFSPDGMFMAFDSDRDGNKGIYLMNINGGMQKRITPKNIKAMNPRWSPYIK